MKDEEFATMYRVEAEHWWYRGLRRMVRFHWQQLAPAGAVAVLDAGCGTGSVLRSLPPSVHAVGIDCSAVAIQFCRRRGLERTSVASLTGLPFADGHFDVVLSCDVLCHAAITDCDQAVAEMARVLKPGGLLFMNLPAYPCLISSHDAAVANVRRFTKGEVLALLERHALAAVRCTYWNTLLLGPIALLRLWSKLWPSTHSDLTPPPVWAAATFSAILKLEVALIGWLGALPFGLSLFIAAKKGTSNRT